MNATPEPVAIPTRARLLALLESLSYQRGRVTLSSGATSDFYVDCKQTALHPEGGWALGNHLLDGVERVEAQLGQRAAGVGGMTLGADPLATAVSLCAWLRGRALPAFIVRKEAKGHGTGRYVEGRRSLPDGSPVILLEDVVTTGGTTLRARERICAERLVPLGVVAIVDRQVGGIANLEAAGLVVESLFRRADFST